MHLSTRAIFCLLWDLKSYDTANCARSNFLFLEPLLVSIIANLVRKRWKNSETKKKLEKLKKLKKEKIYKWLLYLMAYLKQSSSKEYDQLFLLVEE